MPAGRDLTLGLIGAAIAVVTWGSSGVLVKWIPMDGIAIAAWRFLSYFVIIGLWRAARRAHLSVAIFKASLFAGVLLAVDVIFFFSAVKLTSIVNAAIIGAMQPIVLSIYAVRFMGETLRVRDIALSLAALGGVVVVLISGTDSGESSLLGDLCAVGALFAWSAYFVAAKRVDGRVAPADFTLAVALIVAVVCFPVALAYGQDVSWPAADTWPWLLAMALGAGLLGHNMMNWSLPRIPLWIGSTFTLLTPVVSALLAWLFLDEQLTLWQVLAMAVVVAALALLVLDQTRADADPDAERDEALPESSATS